MKERPILFSGAMVRAILSGAKTQTRRVASKPVRHPDLGNLYTVGALVTENEPRHVIERACPYGQPGDRLWVRETHAPQSDCWGSWDRWCSGVGGPAPIIHYAADGDRTPFVERWRPSIHMPRWASRITLEITGVRVERLQDISEADCVAEGCPPTRDDDEDARHHSSARWQYEMLWEQINGLHSWAVNPWVWVVEFERRMEIKNA